MSASGQAPSSCPAGTYEELLREARGRRLLQELKDEVSSPLILQELRNRTPSLASYTATIIRRDLQRRQKPLARFSVEELRRKIEHTALSEVPRLHLQQEYERRDELLGNLRRDEILKLASSARLPHGITITDVSAELKRRPATLVNATRREIETELERRSAQPIATHEQIAIELEERLSGPALIPSEVLQQELSRRIPALSEATQSELITMLVKRANIALPDAEASLESVLLGTSRLRACTTKALLKALKDTQARVHGEDNRVPVTERLAELKAKTNPTPDEVAERQRLEAASTLGHSVVLLISGKYLTPDTPNGPYRLAWRAYRTSTTPALCADVRFANEQQATPPTCTGFVVGTNKLIATAHHCLDDIPQTDMYALFDIDGGIAPSASIPAAQVRKIDHSFRIESSVSTTVDDWVLLRTTEPVDASRLSLTLDPNTAMVSGEQVFIIGYPRGLGQKYADRANIASTTHPIHFTANLDAFDGNSGSPIFNAQTKSVRGILVSGEDDYRIRAIKVTDPPPATPCTDVDVCLVGCGKETAVRIANLANQLQ